MPMIGFLAGRQHRDFEYFSDWRGAGDTVAGAERAGSSLFQLALPLAIGLILAGLCQMLLLWQALGQLAARGRNWPGFSVWFSVSPAGRRMWRSLCLLRWGWNAANQFAG